MAVVTALAATFGTIHLTHPAWYERLWHPFRYQQIVLGHARNYHLDPALLAAVIYQESKFNADAKSDRGAIGLMQLLPDTAKGIAERTGGSKFRVSDLYDPELNVRYGAWYLRHLLDKYGDERTALAAYNAGQANVDELARARNRDPVRRDEGVRRPRREPEDAVSFVSALTLSRIKPDEPETEPVQRGHLTAGIRYVFGSPLVRPALWATTTINFFSFVFFALFILYASRYLVGPGVLGSCSARGRSAASSVLF